MDDETPPTEAFVIDMLACPLCGCGVPDAVLDTRMISCAFPCHCGAVIMVSPRAIAAQQAAVELPTAPPAHSRAQGQVGMPVPTAFSEMFRP